MTARLLTAATLATVLLAPVVPRALTAQSVVQQSDRSRVANDPDVMAAERLFSAWLEGQIAYRGLPGVAVGVVSDQQLVWSKGFGFADITATRQRPRPPLSPRASNSKPCTPSSIMRRGEGGKLRPDAPSDQSLPWFKA